MSGCFSSNGTDIGVPRRIVELVLDLARAAGTYDAGTATGDVLVVDLSLYVVAAALLTSISVQTNSTSPLTLLSANDGSIANLAGGKNTPLNGKNVPLTLTPMRAFQLRSGQKIRYTLTGPTGTGSANLVARYLPISAGAVLS